jgi:hypothetical protein
MGALSLRITQGTRAGYALIVVLLLGGGANTARAQFISPGKLSRAHAELEGIRNCTRCHQLGVAGASTDKCLDCHEPLAARIQLGSGYHATLESRPCAECHKEHFGEDFGLVRFDTARFEHDRIYALNGRHGEIGCRDCHTPSLIAAEEVRSFKQASAALDRTYLGLGELCVSCHESDDPHDGQFTQRSCDECHGEIDWNQAERFDHDLTRYRLTGLHRRVRCRDCHRPLDGSSDAGRLQFTELAYSGCESCHRDPHRGSMGANCSGCHATAGWSRIADRGAVERSFDHSTTEFALEGAHARAECNTCHSARPRRDERLRISFAPGTEDKAYPHPVAADCTSCHVDYHDGIFAETAAGLPCESCHTQTDWTPTTYGIERHNRESKFRLTGAHIPVICSACHWVDEEGDQHALKFRIADQTCLACHSEDDPHAGQFVARKCSECHDTESFSIPDFDHSQTRWPLDGAHRDVACASCHLSEENDEGSDTVRYRPVPTDCKACHKEER